MGGFLNGMMGNDSPFGRTMARIFVIVCANVLFVVFSLPVVTAGPALAALYYVCLKSFRGDGVSNPFKEFWKGFRSNFRQGMACGLLFTGFAALVWIELRMMRATGAPVIMRYGVLGVAFAAVILAVHLFPVMAAFADTIPGLLRNAVFFAAKNPLRMLAMAALVIAPAVMTAVDVYMRPLYAFIWAFFGFGAIAMAGSAMLIGDFSRFLPPVDGEEEAEDGEKTLSQRETLAAMKKMEM